MTITTAPERSYTTLMRIKADDYQHKAAKLAQKGRPFAATLV